jgi:hypothetical protein
MIKCQFQGEFAGFCHGMVFNYSIGNTETMKQTLLLTCLILLSIPSLATQKRNHCVNPVPVLNTTMNTLNFQKIAPSTSVQLEKISDELQRNTITLRKKKETKWYV